MRGAGRAAAISMPGATFPRWGGLGGLQDNNIANGSPLGGGEVDALGSGNVRPPVKRAGVDGSEIWWGQFPLRRTEFPSITSPMGPAALGALSVSGMNGSPHFRECPAAGWDVILLGGYDSPPRAGIAPPASPSGAGSCVERHRAKA